MSGPVNSFKETRCAGCGKPLSVPKYAKLNFPKYHDECRPKNAPEIGAALGLSSRQAHRLLELAKIAPIGSYKGTYGSVSLFPVDSVAQLRAAMKGEIAKSLARQASAEMGVDTKTQRLLKLVDTLTVEDLPDDLWEQARSYYRSRNDGDCADCGPSGLVAFARHHFTNYDAILAEAKRQTGSRKLHDELQDATNQVIEAILVERGFLDKIKHVRNERPDHKLAREMTTAMYRRR